MEGGSIRGRRSVRLKGFDYSQGMAYFVTICTRQREHLLGEVIGVQFAPSRIGEFVINVLAETEHHFPSVKIDSSVLMPNHVHIIFLFDDLALPSPIATPQLRNPVPDDRGNAVCAPRVQASVPRDRKGAVLAPWTQVPVPSDRRGAVCAPRSQFPNRTLGRIVAYFKQQSTKSAGQLLQDPQFRLWQRNYYEHVIRNEDDLRQTREYIANNPAQWALDEYFGTS